MIWGFALGGIFFIIKTFYHISVLWMEHGWDGVFFYYGLGGLFVGLGMLALSDSWLGERTETKTPQG